MKKMRNLILITIIILVLLCVGIALMYFMTDIFKSEKELFYKYSAQMKVSEFLDANFYSEYNKKLETNNKEAEGSISLGISENQNNKEIAKINYTSKSDVQNKLSETEVSVNSQNEELLKFKLVNNEDLYGLLIDGILNKYIVIENNNLKDFAEKLGVTDVSNIPDRIDFDKSKRTEEKIQQIKELYNRYMNILISQVPESNYSKLGKTNIEVEGQNIQTNGYKVLIKLKDATNIITSSLQTARNDEKLFNLINELNQGEQIKINEYQSAIDSLIGNIDITTMDENELNQELISLYVYQNKGKLVRFAIDIYEKPTVKTYNITMDYISNKGIFNLKKYTSEDNRNVIELKGIKTSEVNLANWDITIQIVEDEQIQSTILLNIVRSGDINSNTIQHKITLKSADEDNNQVHIVIDDKVNLITNVDIEKFTDQNYVILNNLSKETLNQLLTVITQKVGEKIEGLASNLFFVESDLSSTAEDVMKQTKIKQMEEAIRVANTNVIADNYTLGSSNVKPSLSDIVNRMKADQYITNEQYQEAMEKGYITVEDEKVYIVDTINKYNANEQQIQLFNSKFTNYQGIQKAEDVKTLMQVIQSNNTSSERHVSVSGISNTPSGVVASINKEKQYRISFTYDDDGYVENIKIEDAE